MPQLNYQQRQIVSKLKLGAALSRNEDGQVFYLDDGKSTKAIASHVIEQMQLAKLLYVDLIGWCHLRAKTSRPARTSKRRAKQKA